MAESDSDSEIEIISARPVSSSAAQERPRSNLPTSVPKKPTAATASSSQTSQTQTQDGAAARKVHKAGAWASAATSTSSSSSGPPEASGSGSADAAAPTSQAKALTAPRAGTKKQTAGTSAAPDRKGKAKATAVEVLTLDSTDDENDSGSPLIVQKRPPRPSLPSTISSVQPTKPKEPARRHSLAHHKSSVTEAATVSSSSEPDPLTLGPRAAGIDRPAGTTTSQAASDGITRDTVVGRKLTTARKSTGGKFSIQKTAAAGAAHASLPARPPLAADPTPAAKPPSSRSDQGRTDERVQRGPSTSVLPRKLPSRPPPEIGTASTSSSSAARPVSTSCSSSTKQAVKPTSTSLSPSKPASQASTSSARQPAGAAPSRGQPVPKVPNRSGSPNSLANATAREKSDTASGDAALVPTGSKAAPAPPQSAPASTSSGTAPGMARSTDKASSSRPAGVAPSANETASSSNGKAPPVPARVGASLNVASSGKEVASKPNAPPFASTAQSSKASMAPTTTVDSDSDIEIISPRRNSPAALPKPASGSETFSKSRGNGASSQQSAAVGTDTPVNDATVTPKVAANGPPRANVTSSASSAAKITPNVPKEARSIVQAAPSPQRAEQVDGALRPPSGDESEQEGEELYTEEDGDDESAETNGRKTSKRRKRRPRHMKEYQISPGGRKGRQKPADAEGDQARKSDAVTENQKFVSERRTAGENAAGGPLAEPASPGAQRPSQKGIVSTPRRAITIDKVAAEPIVRPSQRVPSVELTAADLDKLKLSDSAATTDREQEQPKVAPTDATTSAAPASTQHGRLDTLGDSTADVEMTEVRPTADPSKGESDVGSERSSTSSSLAPETVQSRPPKLGLGRKSTGRRPPQAQIRSTQARRLAAELAAQRTVAQGLLDASIPDTSNASPEMPSAGGDVDGGRSIRSGSETSTNSSTAATTPPAATTVSTTASDQRVGDVPMVDAESAAASGAETTTGSEAPVRAFTTARKSYGRPMVVQSSPSVLSDSELDSSLACDSDAGSYTANDAGRVAQRNGQDQGPEQVSTVDMPSKESTRDGPVRKQVAARKSYGPRVPRASSHSSPDVDEVELDSGANQSPPVPPALSDLSDSATDDSERDAQVRRAKQTAFAKRAVRESYSAARALRQAGAARTLETSPTPLAVDGRTSNEDLSQQASKLSVKDSKQERRQSPLRRPRRSSASLSEAEADDSLIEPRASKRQRTGMAEPSSRSIDLVKLIREEKLPLILAPADVDRDDPVALEEQRGLIFKQREKFKQPWQRQICGPSYDFANEFHTEIQDAINRREKRWAKLHPDELPIRSEYRAMFEAMIIEALSLEYPPLAVDARPKVRVCPPSDLPPEAMPTPPFDFIYTNRVVYDEDIAPVQAPGCGCKGDCNSAENRKTCSCLARQIKACTTKVGGTDRSDHTDFAYDRQGRLKLRVFETHDQIIECNSMCGCGPECINRVVGNRKSISVDIFWTGIAGWGVRLPPSYPGHFQRTIKRGEPLAIYAGELLRTNDAYLRDDHVYSVIGRNYIYDLDAWTVMEDVESLLPRSAVAELKAKSPPPAESQIKTTQKDKGKKGKSKKITTLEELQLIEDSKSISPLYSMDAFNMGNWTRFCNHVCTDWNTMTRPVYIDEADLSRPLFVYFACRDIQPGEEISITYFGGDDEIEEKNLGYTEAEWKVLADKVRDEAPPGHRCYCGKKFCRGRMFDVPADQPMFWQVRNA